MRQTSQKHILMCQALGGFRNLSRLLAAFIMLAILFRADFSSAGTPEADFSETVRVSDLIAHAYQENPSIRAAKAGWQALAEQYRETTAYPDPQFMFTYFPQPIETRLGPQDWNAGISQMIPFPGKLSKAGKIVQTDAHMARLNLDKTIRDITVSLLESFHELTYIREARRIAAQNADLLDHLRKTAETAHAQERGSLTDVLKAQSQVAQLRYEMLLLQELEETEITRINSLLNRPPDARLGQLEKLPFRPLAYTLAEIYPLAEASQEEIQMAGLQMEKAAAKAELARYQNFPDFRIGLFYAGIGHPDVAMPPEDAGQDAIGIQLGMNLPLWFGKNKGRIARAKAEIEKASAAKTARINTTRTQIRNLFFRLQNARRLISLYNDEMLPQASNAMQIAETWFRQGEGSFSDFTEAQAALYNFQLSLARANADYGKFLARLERLTGRNLTEKADISDGGHAGEEAR